MKVVVLTLLLMVSSLISAQTLIQENIETNTVWDKKGSPYLIEKDLVVLPLGSLIIEPGVTVIFSHMTKLEVFGELKATGKKYNKVKFRGKNGADWSGIIFHKHSVAYNEKTAEGSALIHCKFQGSGALPKTLFQVKGTKVKIANSEIEKVYTAIETKRQGKVIVENNTFSNCNRALNIRNSSKAVITGNTIEHCNSVMIAAPTVFTDNTLTDFSGKGKHSGLIIFQIEI